nr:inaD-like protein isoform X1 [Cherax quadricarinatus]XP_053654291.1 inaD-like protein isoform X1 [Cherax quadricarinatus]
MRGGLGDQVDSLNYGGMETIVEDVEPEYDLEKIQKKYGDLKGEVILVDLQKGVNGLGISLAGNKDRTLMSAFVCGLNPSGNAYKDGRIKVGDEVLEVSVMGKGEKDECHGGERG